MNNQFVQLVLLHWRSTVNGLLGLAIVVILAVTALPPNTGRVAIALAVLRALSLALSQDAGKVLATTKANPEPHVEDGHSVPDDPKAVPVTK